MTVCNQAIGLATLLQAFHATSNASFCHELMQLEKDIPATCRNSFPKIHGTS